jgi:hypothetical protein
MMEGAGRERLAQGSVSALEKREGGGLKARGAGAKAKRPLNVTLTAGGEPTDIGRREEGPAVDAGVPRTPTRRFTGKQLRQLVHIQIPALKDVIDATSAAEAAAHQSEGGAGEGRAKRVRKAPKPFGED